MGEPALEARGLGVRRGAREILHGVSLRVQHGEVLALLGPNGAGKSTILRALLGLIEREGEVSLQGVPLDSMSARERASKIAYVPQQGLLNTAFSVEDVVLQGRYAHSKGGRISDRDREALDEATRITRIEHLRARPFTELSHGERRRVLLARALATEARVIVLDEPDAFLDVGQALSLFALLRGLAGAGFAIVVVLHGLDDATRVADRALLLHEGREVATGAPGEVLTAANLSRIYGVRPTERSAPPFELLEHEPELPRERLARGSTGPAPVVLRGRTLGVVNFSAAVLALALGALFLRSPAREAPRRESTAAAPVVELVDRTGKRFIPRDYERIVSASVTADQILAELVEPSRVVAVSSYGKAREPVSYRFAGHEVIDNLTDIERIIELEPDLVLMHNFTRAEVVARLRDAGVEVFDLGELSGADGFERDVRAIGTLLGIDDRARAFAARYRARLERIAGDRPASERPRALYVRVLGGTIYGGSVGTSYHDVIVYAGLRDAAEGRFSGWPSYDPETLLELDPDVLVTPEGNGAALCAREGLRALRACREGRVVELPGELLDDAGLGIEHAARALRRALDD
jgi:ABC-type cobalamin/Fe3+-siderophores transport system ATPase subunit/ABC-type Fe3+-hydroxamate transport system substrate-binding protein